MLPGLMDAHIHVMLMGESAHYLDLGDCNSIASMKEKLSVHAANNPSLAWIVGTNWDQVPRHAVALCSRQMSVTYMTDQPVAISHSTRPRRSRSRSSCFSVAGLLAYRCGQYHCSEYSWH